MSCMTFVFNLLCCFFFFFNLLSKTTCRIYFYAVIFNLHYPVDRLTFDPAIIPEWCRSNLVFFSTSKTEHLYLSARHNLWNTYPLLFDNAQLSISILNILNLSLNQNINQKLQFHLFPENRRSLLSPPFFSLHESWYLIPAFCFLLYVICPPCVLGGHTPTQELWRK